jgi:hypothetical protein
VEFAMNSSEPNSIAGTSGSVEFEETLRLIARLSPPVGLEERVKAGLRTAPALGKARILAWPTALRLETAWMRAAAAATIFAVVIGGSWGVYSRVQSIQPTKAVATPPRVSTQGGFSSAGARRTPQTLNGPMVEHPAAVAQPATAAPLSENRTFEPEPKAPLNPSKSAVAKKAVAPPTVPHED